MASLAPVLPLADGVAPDLLHVNKAAAVRCEICEKLVAMKDWSAHKTGKKHTKTGMEKGKTAEEVRAHDETVTESIPERHPKTTTITTTITPQQPTTPTPSYEVNGAAAVQCKVCDKLIAMKDWGKHIEGKKHLSATSMSDAKRSEHDKNVTSNLPASFSPEKSTRVETPRDSTRTTAGDKTPQIKMKNVTGIATSSYTVTCDYTMYTTRGEAMCGDIATSSRLPSAYMTRPVIFDIRIDKASQKLFAHNVNRRNVTDAPPPNTLVEIPDVKLDTDCVDVQYSACVDGLTFAFKICLQKMPDGSVRYTRGRVVRELRSGFFFDVRKYCLRSRCGAFCFPFTFYDDKQLQQLAVLRAFIRSTGCDAVPDEASERKEHTYDDPSIESTFSEVRCPDILHKISEAWKSYGPKFHKVWRISNDRLEEKFNETHEKLSREEGEYIDIDYGFHGTDEANLYSISTKGFDISKRNGQAYGPGEYFAITPATSVSYARGGSYLFFCKLIIGTSEVHSRYISGCRYHVIRSQKDTVMALPMYLVKFRKERPSTPNWLLSLEGTPQENESSTNTDGKKLCVRPLDESTDTLILLGSMVAEFTVCGVAAVFIAKTIKIINDELEVNTAIAQNERLGYAEIHVQLVVKVAGKALGELRDRIFDTTRAPVVIRTKKPRCVSPTVASDDTKKLWKEMPKNGTYHELVRAYDLNFTVMKFCSPRRFHSFTSLVSSLRSRYPPHILQEKHVFLASPLSPTALDAFLTGDCGSEVDPASLSFSLKPETTVECGHHGTRFIMCCVVTLGGELLGTCESILPLYAMR
eukprot:TRINITY_DN18_c3_g1_i1.p1 TRINITY_DN18_c3_g1~~TRINITY_DN18_c3_g1_i1.p1  ORF type:complete len:808 (+),score=118.05 TRINITY_DN18_c3_g1_i1:49-2472(+)